MQFLTQVSAATSAKDARETTAVETSSVEGKGAMRYVAGFQHSMSIVGDDGGSGIGTGPTSKFQVECVPSSKSS